MNDIRQQFFDWLNKEKNYKKNKKTGVSPTSGYYVSYIYKVLNKLKIHDWDALAINIQPLLLIYHITPKQLHIRRGEIYYCIDLLCSNFVCDLDLSGSMDIQLSCFWKSDSERIRIKRALDLFYEFLISTEYPFYKYKDENYFPDTQSRHMYELKRNLPSISTPGSFIPTKPNEDGICKEDISGVLRVKETTLYNYAKAGLIKKYKGEVYSIDSINQLLSKDRVIVEETSKSKINLNKKSKMLTVKEAAKLLGCDIYQVGRYREKKHLSYQKLSPEVYLYFRPDVIRLKKWLDRKKKK